MSLKRRVLILYTLKTQSKFSVFFLSNKHLLFFLFLYAYGAILFAWLDKIVPITYHLTPINIEGNEFKIHGIVLFLWGIFFGSVLICSVLAYSIFKAKDFLKNHFSNFNYLDCAVLVWFCCNVLSFIIGLSLNNKPRYLLSDTFALSIIPLVYLLGRFCIVKPSHWRITFYFLVAIQTILTISGFLVFYGANTFIIFAFLVFTLNSKKMKVFYLILFLLTTEIALLKTKLGFALQFILGVLALCAIEKHRKGFFVSFLFVLVVFLITRPIFNQYHINKIDYSSYFHRVNSIIKTVSLDSFFLSTADFVKNKAQHNQKAIPDELLKNRALLLNGEPDRALLSGEPEDISTNQRLYEADMVMNKLASEKPISFFFGLGNGATLDLSQTPDETIKAVYEGNLDQVHCIHLLPFAILYRQGLVGILQYFVLFLALLMCIRHLLNTAKNTAFVLQTEILALYLFVMIIGAFLSASHFSVNLLVAVSISLISTGYSMSKEAL